MVKVCEVTARPRVQKFFKKPSLTRQEFKQECDLSYILKKFSNDPHGMQALLAVQNSRYEDVSDIPDYRTALDQVNVAKAKFMALPAILRRRFNNDPAEFLDFCSDSRNLEELRSLGLAKPAQSVEPVADATPPKGSEGT